MSENLSASTIVLRTVLLDGQSAGAGQTMRIEEGRELENVTKNQVRFHAMEKYKI